MRGIGFLAAALLLLAAACGDDAADTTTTTAATTTTTAPTTTTTAPTTTMSAGTTTTTAPTTTTLAGPVISIADTSAGSHLVDDEGMTLYAFSPDEQGVSQCSGGCATTWPPLIGEYGAGNGVNPILLGTVARSDGTLQVTYNGRPLYRYAQDDVPGDVEGQGAGGGNWRVVDADGEPIM